MSTLVIATEEDFRKWVKEAVLESVESSTASKPPHSQKDEQLFNRKAIAEYVTLSEWMKRGLPFHKVRGRVFFQRSAVLEYVKSYRPRKTGI